MEKLHGAVCIEETSWALGDGGQIIILTEQFSKGFTTLSSQKYLVSLLAEHEEVVEFVERGQEGRAVRGLSFRLRAGFEPAYRIILKGHFSITLQRINF